MGTKGAIGYKDLRDYINLVDEAGELIGNALRSRGLHQYSHRCWSTPLDPRIAPEERERKNFTNSVAIINACRPYHWLMIGICF